MLDLAQRQPTELVVRGDVALNLNDHVAVALAQETRPLLRLELVDQNPALVSIDEMVEVEWQLALVHLDGTFHGHPVDVLTLETDFYATIEAGVDPELASFVVTVSDGAILSAMRDVGRHGVFAEPAAATAVAGVRAAVETGLFGAGEDVLAMITGNGLKDTKVPLGIPYPWSLPAP